MPYFSLPASATRLPTPLSSLLVLLAERFLQDVNNVIRKRPVLGFRSFLEFFLKAGLNTNIQPRILGFFKFCHLLSQWVDNISSVGIMLSQWLHKCNQSSLQSATNTIQALTICDSRSAENG